MFVRRRINGRLVMVLAFLFLVSTPGNPQQHFDDRTVESIEHDVVQQLLKEDLRAVVENADKENPATTKQLLRQLLIYQRASRPDGVTRTLHALADAPDWDQAKASYRVRTLITRSLEADLDAWRFYYERLRSRDSEGAESFIRLWEAKGDRSQIDQWLANHSSGLDEWFRIRIFRRAKEGTAGELLDPLAAAVRSSPRDLSAIEHYLKANNLAGNLQDVTWIGDTSQLQLAYENFELGRMLGRTSPAAAAHALEKSLSLPITPRDVELLQAGLRLAVTPPHLNYEKQLRFWTKQHLAQSYQALHRPQEAQPIVEELMKMKGEDVLSEDAAELAGSVQSQSGQRVVERQFLYNEAEQQKSPQYWLERASYFRGREETDLTKDTYVKALAALPYTPKNQREFMGRLQVVRAYAYFLNEIHSRQELTTLLRTEFTRASADPAYRFEIARLINQNDFELDDLRYSLLVAKPIVVAELLSPRGDWGSDEGFFIHEVVSGDRVSVAEREVIWTELIKLVDRPSSPRAY